MRRANPAVRSDEGAVLIFALIITTTIALVVGALLTRGDGSLRATVTLREVAGTSYAADAAANLAINDLRTGEWAGTAPKSSASWAFNNDPYDGCFGRDAVNAAGDTTPATTLTLNGFYPASGTQTSASSATVVCTPEDATGEQGSPVAITDGNKPGNAILTLGTDPADGFTFKTNGSGGAFRVKGGIWSNSTISRDSNGQLESTESIRAHSGCTPLAAMRAPIVDCGASAVTDPAYASDLGAATAAPALQIPPTTCGSGSVTLNPGSYDDANLLNALTPNGGSNCFIHLNPGTYYFDFHNNSADPMYQSGIAGNVGDVWNVNSGVIVGGTLTSDTTVPGRCISPIDDATPNQGVQLIFGGDSRMVVDKGAQVELCGSYHAASPPIAVYGQQTGTTAAATSVTGLTGSPITGNTGFIRGANGNTAPTASDVSAPDGTFVSFKRPQTGSASATLTVGGFAPATAIPKGAVLTGAKVKAVHGETAASTFALTPTGAGAPTLTADLPVQPVSAPGVLDTVDLSTKASWGAFQKYVHDNGYTAGSATFTANPKSKGDVSYLDSMKLDLTYVIPQLRAESMSVIPGNTVATTGGSPVIWAQGNTTLFYTHGTTYAPRASIKLELNNISESVFRFGVIARALTVFETASFAYEGAVIELPDKSPGWGFDSTLVQLTVYLCPASPTCSASGTPALKTRLQVWDPDASGPVPNKRQITVLSWSHSR